MGLRQQKIEEQQKGEIIQKKVKELLNKAKNAMDLFPDRPKPEEIKEVEDLLEEARLELKELFSDNYDTVRTGLSKQYSELQNKLEKYKINSSEVKNERDLLLKEYGDFNREYDRKSAYYKVRFEECSNQSDFPKLRGVTEELKGFYENSLKLAEPLRDKMIGKQGYDSEFQSLTKRIDDMRDQINSLEQLLIKLSKTAANPSF